MTRREGLAVCLRELRAGRRPHLARALVALAGCPVGGWGETGQAMRRVADALPFRADRTYTLDDLVDAVMTVDAADRWRLSVEVES